MFRSHSPRRYQRWTNWAGTFSCRPAWYWEPSDLSEMMGVVQFARGQGQSLRPVGAGYSYTRLVQTDHVLVSLARFTGIEHLDERRGIVTVRAGTRLHDLTAALARRGYALENMGDVDVQTIAGAIGTGTHGTGLSLGSMSTQVVGLTLVTGTGEVVELDADRDPERLAAAQVSLGALGLIVLVRLKVLPLYHLLVERWASTLDDTLERLEEETRSNRHFEFFWIPDSNVVLGRRMNLAHGARTSGLRSPVRMMNEVFVENGALWGVSELVSRWPTLRKKLIELGSQTFSDESDIRPAHQGFASPRWVKHQETEYAIPVSELAPVLRELNQALSRHGVRTAFPIEVRFCRRDDALLSPSYGRDVAYVAAHTYIDEDHRDYFDVCEDVFRAHSGRPHWGKLHGCSAAELQTAYPRWSEFQRLRAELDPEGVFQNPYLEKLFAARPRTANVAREAIRASAGFR